MIILVIFFFTFSFAFYIVAQNQINFDKVESDDVIYSTMYGSFQYVGGLLIGNPDTDAFDKGDASMEVLLNLIFWLACFIIMILLLNMLIAIMGNTFTIGNESLEQQKYREHLNFVIDNWFMRKLAFKITFKDINSVSYIVTAFSANDGEDHDPVFEEIKDTIETKTEAIINLLKKQDDKIKDLQRMVTKIIRKDDPDG